MSNVAVIPHNEGTDNYVKERLAFYIEWYVLDYDGSGYNVFVCPQSAWRRWTEVGSDDVAHRRRAPRRRKVRIVVGGQRAIVRNADLGIVEPLLARAKRHQHS